MDPQEGQAFLILSDSLHKHAKRRLNNQVDRHAAKQADRPDNGIDRPVTGQEFWQRLIGHADCRASPDPLAHSCQRCQRNTIAEEGERFHAVLQADDANEYSENKTDEECHQ